MDNTKTRYYDCLESAKTYVSMIRKYHNNTLQTNPRHREKDQQNTDSPKHQEDNKIKASSSLKTIA